MIFLKKITEKIKLFLKKTEAKSEYRERILKARTELMDAERSFNETVDADYIDIAILNLNLARKKYELCISEAKALYKAG